MVSHIVRRVREERLPQVAGGLTLATALSLVPLLAVSFALFEHVANLRPAGAAVRDHLLRGLLPPEAARLILQHLTRFISNSISLPAIGFAFLLVSALGLLWSVEGTLNRIWQVTKPRPVLRRIALCAVWLLVGPAFLGASLWATSSLDLSSAGWAQEHRAWWSNLAYAGPVLLGTVGFTLLFRMVPNTHVRWSSALLAGLLAAIAFELGKRGFALLLLNMPVQRTIYGALAPLLAFLMWLYYSWVVTLTAALIGAGRRGGRDVQRQLRRR